MSGEQHLHAVLTRTVRDSSYLARTTVQHCLRIWIAVGPAVSARQSGGQAYNATVKILNQVPQLAHPRPDLSDKRSDALDCQPCSELWPGSVQANNHLAAVVVHAPGFRI